MDHFGVRPLVFSSTAAVYGIPDRLPIHEDWPCLPINPYGESKLAAEALIAAAAARGRISAACLRYFNAIGADPGGEAGECHHPETHLVPNLIHAALNGNASPAVVYGGDYDTPDGTCVRDYVDVLDLCEAHLAALNHLEANGDYQVFNLGSGTGHSVLEVLASVRSACGGLPTHRTAGRRPGDPPTLVAGIRRAATILKWSPRTTLDASVRNALAWHLTSKVRSSAGSGLNPPG
jgi:UDP-glucose-4-epimerase GalE